MIDGQGGAFQFLPQFHGVANLVRRLAANLFDVITIAYQLIAIGDGGGGGGSEVAGIAGTQTHQVQFAIGHTCSAIYVCLDDLRLPGLSAGITGAIG